MIRFISIVIFVPLFLICSIPLLGMEWLLGKWKPDWKDRSSLAIVNWAFSVCLKLSGVKITVIGEEHVPKDTAVLYVANHRSYFDILLTYTRVPRPTGYIAKKEMLRYPLLTNWMRNLHCLFLDRSDIKQGLKTILEAVEKVKSGISICIFPEGTRNKEKDTFLPFHEGSFKIAEKSGCPIVPIAINHSAAIFEDQFPRIKKTHVVLEYCKPIYPADLSKEERKFLGSHVQKIIEEAYFKNNHLD